MTFEILLEVFLFGIALAMDAFMVSITQGLTFKDINKKKSLFIAFTYGFFQALFPLIGFFLIHLITILANESTSEKAGSIIEVVVSWLSFIILVFLGTKMIIEAIKESKKAKEERKETLFSIKQVLLMGVVTAIDALATGIAFHSTNTYGVSLSSTSTIWLHVAIIMAVTFVICLLGLILARKIHKLLKGKEELSSLIGGLILIILGIWILLSHYFNI